MNLSAEILTRGMPLALKILIPVFAVLSIAIGILIGWCLMDTSEKEEEEGGEAAKESNSEDKAGLKVNFFQSNSLLG
jgi:flagellar basal body-associated protein FliL